MTKKEKLLELKKKLDTLQTPPVDSFKDSLIAQEIANISGQLKNNPTIKTLQKFNADLTKLNTELLKVKTQSETEDKAIRLDLAPIQQSIRTLQKELKQADYNLQQEFTNKINALPQVPDLTEALAKVRAEFNARLNAIPKDDDTALEQDLENIRQQLQDMVLADEAEDKLEKEELDKTLAKLRLELLQRINNIGGGSMNRQVLFNGVDRLTKYTDYNLKPGANVTFTVATNDAAKRVDLTIAATGGSGSGITRSINSISAPTTAAAASTTDYVYLVSGTTTLTLPDATTNSNLYTVKNVGTGTVTINTTAGQTIDGSLTITMPVQFTSIDLISDTANWSIT